MGKGDPSTLYFRTPVAMVWSLPSGGAARLIRKIREFAVGGVYTNIDQAVRGIVSRVSPAGQDSGPEPMPR